MRSTRFDGVVQQAVRSVGSHALGLHNGIRVTETQAQQMLLDEFECGEQARLTHSVSIDEDDTPQMVPNANTESINSNGHFQCELLKNYALISQSMESRGSGRHGTIDLIKLSFRPEQLLNN